jgi:hypothetical protein
MAEIEREADSWQKFTVIARDHGAAALPWPGGPCGRLPNFTFV